MINVDATLKPLLLMLHSMFDVKEKLSNEFLTQPDKLKELLGSSFSWAEIYAHPFHVHLSAFAHLSGMTPQLLSILDTENPIQAAFNLVADEDVTEWKGGPDKEFDEGKLIALHHSFILTTESMVIWSKWLNELVDDVRHGNDISLFKAVQIDRSIISCPAFADRIALAEIQQDEEFFEKLRKALRDKPRKPKEEYAVLRYLLYFLQETGQLKELTVESSYQIFCEELKVYPADRADSARSLWQFIQRWKKVRST